MALKIYRLGNPPISSNPPAAAQPFTFRVPGQFQWQVLSVLVTCSRNGVAANTRAFVLSMGDATTTVVTVPILDPINNTNPATLMWAGNQQVTITPTGALIAVAPLRRYILPAGYKITGSFVAPGTARYLTAAVWVDEVPSRP